MWCSCLGDLPTVCPVAFRPAAVSERHFCRGQRAAPWHLWPLPGAGSGCRVRQAGAIAARQCQHPGLPEQRALVRARADGSGACARPGNCLPQAAGSCSDRESDFVSCLIIDRWVRATHKPSLGERPPPSTCGRLASLPACASRLGQQVPAGRAGRLPLAAGVWTGHEPSLHRKICKAQATTL